MDDNSNINVLICEFIGRRGKIRHDLFWTNINGIYWVLENELKFDSSWDWLMGVIEKIEKLGFDYNCKKIDNNIMVGYNSIIMGNKYNKWVLGNDRFSSTLDSVIQFIKWYNSTNGKKR